MAPEEIRAIRQRLKLTQVEAGELLGGGPRAFTKYESGAVTPAASVINLLRLLEADPTCLELLTGRESRPAFSAVTGPFKVTAEHVSDLTPAMFPLLLQRLVNAEADTAGLPHVRLHVPTQVHTPDGGEDGRVRWHGGLDHTRFLPARFCVFELKSGPISAARARHVVLDRSGSVKPMVRAALEENAVYVVLCAHPYVQKDIEVRESRIREALRGAGMTIEDTQVEFRDAEQIAAWANRHPSVAMWLKEQVPRGSLGPFRSWSESVERVEHAGSRWVEDARIPDLRAKLRSSAMVPRSTFRIVGPSGIGKSRLALEALRPTVDEEETGHFLSDLVMYADLSDSSAETINGIVQRLAGGGQRAIVVVDRCPIDSHRVLAAMVSRSGSGLSLITIDEEAPVGTPDPSTFTLAKAPPSVAEAIVDRDLPNVSSTDRRRLAEFSRGFPEIAIRVARAWAQTRPIAHATDDDLVDAFVLGRTLTDRDRLLPAAMLLAAFGIVHIDDRDESELSEIATRGGGITAQNLHAAFVTLIQRGVAQRRGRAVVLQPRPIAMNLTERQWRAWTSSVRKDVLTGAGSPALKVMAARQLAWLNNIDFAREVVREVCRPGGPFDGFEGLATPSHARVLSSLAEIDSEVVCEEIERSLDDVEDLRTIEGDVRRDLVWALEKIAFRPNSFEDGAQLLLRLALAENETWGNNATGQFKRLFPLLLADTAAPGVDRLSLLEDVAQTNNPEQLAILVDALIDASSMDHFSRFLGSEVHGSRPALEPWRPATHEEAVSYVSECLTRLTAFARNDDDLGRTARTGLAQNLQGLLSNGLIGPVESAVRQVRDGLGAWPEPLEGLGRFLLYDAQDVDPAVVSRVRALIDELKPRSLEARVRHFVTDMPYDFPSDEELDFEVRDERQRDALHALAAEVAAQPAVLDHILPGLNRGEQRKAHVFGRALPALLDSPAQWLERIVSAFVEVPLRERNPDFLAAYVAGMAATDSEAAEAFKSKAAQSAELAPALPLICFRCGITPLDITLALAALEDGLLAPSDLLQWTVGRSLDDLPVGVVAHLFDSLFEHSVDAFDIGVDLLGMYAHGDSDKQEALRPQVRRAAECVMRWSQTRPRQLAVHRFGRLVRRILENGRDDPDARSIALILARTLVSDKGKGQERFVEPVLDLLLSKFPEITWPLIGQAIVSDPRRAWRMEGVLGGSIGSVREKAAPLLELPEDTLFAWCHAHPDAAPAFVARVVPALTAYGHEPSGRSLHPVLLRLLDDFGDRDDLLDAMVVRMHSFGWWGSLTSYFALYEPPLRALLEHPKGKVRRWARRTLRGLSESIKAARDQDDEWDAQWEL